LLIFEVEEVGRVIYAVRSLSSANHQSSIINHPVQNYSWFKISGQGFLVPTRGQSSRLSPQASRLLRGVWSRSSPRWARRASTQKDACVGRSSEFTFPLVVGGQRAVDR